MKKRERCAGDGVLQALLDGELSGSYIEKVQNHLQTCIRCEGRFRQMAQWSDRVRNVLSSGGGFEGDIPVFIPRHVRAGLPAQRKLLAFVIRVAAVVVLGIFTWLMVTDTKPTAYEPTPYDLLLWEEASRGNDANRHWHNRSVVIMITGPDGETEIINLN